MGTIKDRNGKDLTEAEEINKRWQEYTEELYRKDFHDPDNHDVVVTHLVPDILECEVKGALGSITSNKASGGDEVSAELFQILKDYAVKVLHSICQQIWKTQQWPQDWKRSVFIPIPKKGNAKESSNYRTRTLISPANKVMLKILQARLQQYMNQELPDVRARFRKGRGTRDQINNIHWTIEKTRVFQKNICFIDYAKLFVWITTNWKFLKWWEYQTTLPVSWENSMQVKKPQLELNIEQWIFSKLRKEYVKAAYYHPVFLTSMQNSCMLIHFSCVWLFATLWTLAHQAPVSMKLSRQEYWSGLLCPPSGDLPNPGMQPTFLYVSCIGKWVLYL